MTPELKAHLDALEAEYADLSARYATARAAYDKLAAAIAPHQAEQRKAEAFMDTLKPRLAELEAKLPALRKAVG